MRIASLPAALAALLLASPALADSITVTKTALVVSDPVGDAAPKSLPGAVVDYRMLATNPIGNALKPVSNMVLTDMLDPTVKMRVSDIGTAGKGPVEFVDGSLLGLGLGGSGLSYTFTSLASASDGLEFWNGTTWAYTPVPDADGYDANVRGIRVTLTSTFNTSGSFQLRFRTMIK